MLTSLAIEDTGALRSNLMIRAQGGETGLVKTPTGVMTRSRCLIEEHNKKCDDGHDHIPLTAGIAAGAAIYPEPLCEAIC